MSLRDLKFMLLISGVLFFSQGVVLAEYPSNADFVKWQSCQTCEDCTISKDPCENYVGVNKKYFKEYTDWSEKEYWHCRALGDNAINQDTRIVCFNSVCQVGKLAGSQTVSPEEVKAIDTVYKSKRKH
jgi:hypothetical protein